MRFTIRGEYFLKKLKLVTVFGTRPEAIKMAPVVLTMKKYQQFIEPFVVVTAQHREMLDQVLALFDIKPDYDLSIMSPRQTLYDISCKALLGLGDVFSEIGPDMVLVHGDTTTTFMGALAAYYQKIAIGHVEAGLRTGSKYSPFPEEANRQLTGVLADYHFAPTQTAKENLFKENIKKEDVFVTGNTVIDALQATVKEEYEFKHTLLAECIKRNNKIILVTTHRRENLGEPLRNIYKALRKIVEERPDVEAIFPVHKNPLVHEIVQEELAGQERIHLIDPLEYEPFANLMARSYLILSDSGGVQEEAPALGVPVLVLRDTTERPEAIEAGTVKLVGTSIESIFSETNNLLDNKNAYLQMSESSNPYGDGLASERIIRTILAKHDFPIDLPKYF